MLTFLIGKRQRAIAWFFFILFYADMVSAAYASNRTYSRNPVMANYSNSSFDNTDSFSGAPPKIIATLVSRDNITKTTKKGSIKSENALALLKKATSAETENLKPITSEKVTGPGPGQPEMSTFKSVGADNMVNLFTGDFSYNIPLLDVDGYPVNIFYNAGATMDQEASWVGLGWNINPGTINRNMRGLPDDFDGSDKVTKEMSMKPDVTIGVNGSKSREVVGMPDGFHINDLSAGVFYNNKRGLGLDLSAKGEFISHKNIALQNKDDKTQKDTTISVNSGFTAGIDLNSQTGLTPSVSFQKNLFNKGNTMKYGLSTSIDFNSRSGLGDLQLSGEITNYNKAHTLRADGDIWNTNISFARSSYTPSIRMPVTNFNASFVVKLGKEEKPKFKFASISGYYTKSSIARKYSVQEKDAFGYMYYEKANNNKDALLDFNRLNDGGYTLKTPIISIPVYTYDVFTITGEGTGGSFRGYRGNMGYVQDPYCRTNSGKVNLAVELGGKSIFHGGTAIGGVYSNTTAGGWEKDNQVKTAAAFKTSERDVQMGFYFKNPGEKAIIDEAYYNKMGADKLMRLRIGSPAGYVSPFSVAKPTLKNQFQLYNSLKQEDVTIPIDESSYRSDRDKRTQVISFLTAIDADKVGLDQNIYSYREGILNPGACQKDNGNKIFMKRYGRDAGNYRKANHISEITVQEGSQRYVYSLPVYQLTQKDVTISVENKVPVNGIITYDPAKNNSSNDEGKDGLFQKETLDPFPHSFLLTGILSADYSDITGDGISDDDLGTAIKFNYTRPLYQDATGTKKWDDLNWRLPATPAANTANFNRGLVTDNTDDKASYSYGSKELWYMNSIESKNMIAVFTTSNRLDGWGVFGENGSIWSGNGAPCQKKLEKIDLYSKADVVKYGAAAKPIKTVHFTYSYKLCKGYSMFVGDASAGNGKLTLESIYFTYNNNGHQKNKYLFKYANEDAPYNPVEYDRWGNYKPHSQNPQDANVPVSNEDYPYAVQNKANADANAGTWNLTQILLPSGARIDVNYEADDYAYVQDRRAAQMTKIVGFGPTAAWSTENKLFDRTQMSPWDFSHSDYRYIFFNSSVHLNSKADIARLYLQDLKQLLLKLWIKMPGSTFNGIKGYEPMFIYCDIDDYGTVGSDGDKFFVKIGKASRKSVSQIMETDYQYLRDQLPGKAYPGYDIGNSTAAGQLVKALFAMVNNIRTGVAGFENSARMDNWAREVDLVRSGARLCNPEFKKLGGGHRVKSIKILDNWKRMTGSDAANAPDINSYYGQEYEYTSTEIVNGQPQIISSGVASYEPGVGNEENPFREVLQYNKSNPLGPTELGNVELPIAETFFPSSFVGYSRVTVKSIHNKNKANPAENENIKSGVGMQETLFYTTRDFPTFSDYTDMAPDSRHHFKPSPINKIFNFSKKDYVTLSQGFRVILNDMNGKTKMQASYPENDLKNPINKTTYHYRMDKIGENKYALNNVIPVISGPDGKITNKMVGKDIEVMNDFRDHLTATRSLQVPLNVEFFTAGGWPVLIPTVFRAVFRDESLFRSATTLKVINQYGILESVENMDKGSIVSTQNLVYNAETGDALVTGTQNEFNKPIYNFSYPAYWAVDNMGPAYKNIDATFNGLLFRHGKIDAGLSPEEVNKYFASGDEIYVTDHSDQDVREYPACDPNTTCGNFTMLPKSSEFRIWALDVTKDSRNTVKEFIFIDRYGVPYNANNADIRIIRSGRRNMMDASVGSITSMKNPILLDANNNYDKIVINNATDVVNSGAMEYKEKWKVQDAFRELKTTTTEVKRAPVVPLVLYPVETIDLYTDNFSGTGNLFDVGVNVNLPFVRAHMEGYHAGGKSHRVFHKDWLRFDLSSIEAGAVLKNAYLSLYKHDADHPLSQHNFHYAGNPYGSDYFARYNFPLQYELSRYTRPTWPSGNSDWINTGNAVVPSSLDKQFFSFPFGHNDLSQGSIDRRIPVGSMVNNMLRDRDDPTKHYLTAFRLKLFQELQAHTQNYTEYVCFNNYWGNTAERMRPKLELGIVDCGHPFGPGNPEPVNPPYEIGECVTTTTITTCLSVFNDNFINPYVRGLLGDWRPLKSYVYYGERREQDPASVTNISKDGIIKDFEPFWNLDPVNKQITKTGSTKWTWNSEITQYNRKGAELENKDPLNRYNASIYGYNEALPIAVVNNSKLRQSAFEGFEDYFFKDQGCDISCNPNKRHFDTHIYTELLDPSEAHTGKYSLRTDHGTVNTSTTSIKIPISADNNAADANTPDLRIGITKTVTNVPTVNLQGTGLMGIYQHDPNTAFKLDPVINFSYGHDRSGDWSVPPNSMPYPIEHKGGNRITWTGRILVDQSGAYSFSSIGTPDDNEKIYINGSPVFDQVPITTVDLQAGTAYPVTILFTDRFHGGILPRNTAHYDFSWRLACATTNYQLVPAKNMYPTQEAADASVHYNNPYTCTNVSTIKPLTNYLIDGFNLIYDKKMVASVWVKKGKEDCRCPQYDGVSIKLRTSAGATIGTAFTAKSPIIEGWQLFETEFDVPSSGSEIELFVDNSAGDQNVYIDDLRFHPYNSNMKSFVYNPYNLKPAAELDENNYATFYEYDDDGTLIRVKKETKLGVKTIQETRSSLQKKVTEL